MTAPFKEYPYQPRYNFEPPDLPDIPFRQKPPAPNWPLPLALDFRALPSATKPTVDGYPWWVDPPGFLNPPPAPELPPFQLGPTDFGNRRQSPATNWLLSYYDQKLAQQSDRGIDPAPPGAAPQSDVPERRLAVIRGRSSGGSAGG